jgi:hypothetical protein
LEVPQPPLRISEESGWFEGLKGNPRFRLFYEQIDWESNNIAGLERGAFPVKTGGERYKTPGQYRSDLKGQTADGVLVIGRGI